MDRSLKHTVVRKASCSTIIMCNTTYGKKRKVKKKMLSCIFKMCVCV